MAEANDKNELMAFRIGVTDDRALGTKIVPPQAEFRYKCRKLVHGMPYLKIEQKPIGKQHFRVWHQDTLSLS